uniref:Uncharacterized protein n=1 Tax=Nicotiana tabacum TaxID=4097 RepID=A0A1S3ZGR3_TOBAC|nr:uncharacterized protein LOC104085076 [Nicotiana tomentosiformis]XP_016463462.1 PREDICTED: uncharacterized protein LOC107786487 [Nicotiana tabacum]
MSALRKNYKEQSTTRRPLSNGHYHLKMIDGCFKCDKQNYMIKNCLMREVEWKEDRFKIRNRKKEQIHDKKNYKKRPSKAIVVTWNESLVEDINVDDNDVERALIAIRESEDEPDEESEISLSEGEKPNMEQDTEEIELIRNSNMKPQSVLKLHHKKEQVMDQEGTSKEIDTHITTSSKLDLDEPGSSADQKFVGIWARFQANPKDSHLAAVKRILRYLKGTTDLCIWYPKSSNFNLVGYVDADYTGFLATKKQNSVALSTDEAECVVDASCCAQLLWIKQ